MLLKYLGEFYILVTCSFPIMALNCWRCVGTGCDQDPSQVTHAEQTRCKEGDSCLKVHYEMAEYNSSIVYKSVIRTCSTGTCQSTHQEQYLRCKKQHRHYKIYGCSYRICCSDQDLCNAHSPLKGTLLHVLMTLLVLLNY